MSPLAIRTSASAIVSARSRFFAVHGAVPEVLYRLREAEQDFPIGDSMSPSLTVLIRGMMKCESAATSASH